MKECSHRRARRSGREMVKFEHTLTAHHPQLPPVYSTPDMIPSSWKPPRFAPCMLIAKTTKSRSGTAINVEHRVAVGIGAKIRAGGSGGIIRRQVLYSAGFSRGYFGSGSTA